MKTLIRGLVQIFFEMKSWEAEPEHPRDLKTALLCGSFLRKGEVLAYVGLIHNLKELKDDMLNPKP